MDVPLKMFSVDSNMFQLSSPGAVVEESLDSKSYLSMDNTSSLEKKAEASMKVSWTIK